jgi:hypothetical protein
MIYFELIILRAARDRMGKHIWTVLCATMAYHFKYGVMGSWGRSGNNVLTCILMYIRQTPRLTMKNVVFWDIEIQFVLHRRHYVSATEPSQLMLCKI